MTDQTPSEPPVITQPAAAAGWYPDATTGKRRWWDGAKWTDTYAPESKGTAAMVLGIIAIVLSVIPGINWAGLVLAIIALILGLVGLANSAKRTRSIVGAALGGLAIVLTIVLGVVYATAVFGAASAGFKDGAAGGSSDSSNSAPKQSAPKSSAPKANAYDAQWGKFAPITKSGTSDAVVTLPPGFNAGILTATYRGSDNFSVNGIDSNNKPTGDLPVNTIGNYSGVSTLGFDAVGNPDAALQISGHGSWTITVSPVSSATTTVPASGKGDAVFLYNGGAADWTFKNVGSGNFIVNEYTPDGLFPGIDINEIGNYSGQVPVDAGPAVVELISDGSWTISQ